MSRQRDKKPALIKLLTLDGIKLDYNKFSEELSDATYALGLLQGSLKKIQNPQLLVSPLTAKEAVMSSKIEGTQSDVSEVFMFEAGEKTEHGDIQEVINYRTAIGLATQQIKEGRSLTSHLIQSLHSVLLKGVRHKGNLGKFRDGQVWIAERAGDPIEQAIYIPPESIHVTALIENLFKYIGNGKESALIKAAIAHYQFEAIHPFDDGNGRIGRLFIPIILFEHGKLNSPVLYLSGYFDEHKDEYIEKLHEVDEGADIEEWIKFFLNSVATQLSETQNIIEKIYELYDKVKQDMKGTKSPYMSSFIEMLFISPIFTIKMAQEYLGATPLTVSTLIKDLDSKGYVTEMGSRKKNKLFSFYPFLDILE